MTDDTHGLPTGPLDLLAKAALAQPDVARQAWLEWRDKFSLDETPWNQVRMLASVAPRLNWLEREAGIAPRIQGIRKFLYAHTQTCLMGAMPGMEALNAARIPFMMMKGAARIARNSAAAQERLIRDVDLLVPFKEKSHAFEVIHDLGWRFKASEQWQDFWRGVDETNHHAWALAKGNSEIDLHHHSNVLNRLVDDDTGLWMRAESTEWRGISLYVPTVTDNLLISIVHGIRWSLDNAADWTIDACASIDGGAIDWPVFVSEVKQRRLQAITVPALNYLRETLARPIHDDVVADLQGGITPAQVSEMERYTTAPTTRNFQEIATAYSMSLERLSAHGLSHSGHQTELRVEFPFVQNEPSTISIDDLPDDTEILELTVRLQTNLPAGTKLLGTVGILGLLMDKTVVETGKSQGTKDVCELSFSVFLPLLRGRGVQNLIFVAGVLGQATPLYWNRAFTA